MKKYQKMKIGLMGLMSLIGLMACNPEPDESDLFIMQFFIINFESYTLLLLITS